VAAPLLISDAAVNVAPDIETRVEAALHMAEMSRRLGQSRPRIAVLSATGVSFASDAIKRRGGGNCAAGKRH
jgi:phosphotransacetylase